jgi:hypothetical protein
MATKTTPPRRGVATVHDLRARSIVDPATHCWAWQGAQIKGSPRIWALDIDKLDKTVLSGPRAVWYIANGTALGSKVAYMACWNKGCVCPVHVRAASRAEVNRQAGKAGTFTRTGPALAATVANLAKARAARGAIDTPPHLVLAVRAVAGTTTQQEISRRLGLTKTVVSRIVRGQSFRHLVAEGTPASPATWCIGSRADTP